jgi:hypothetical protein
LRVLGIDKLTMQGQSFLQTTIDSHTKVCVRRDVQLLPHAARPDRTGCLLFHDMYAIPDATRWPRCYRNRAVDSAKVASSWQQAICHKMT